MGTLDWNKESGENVLLWRKWAAAAEQTAALSPTLLYVGNLGCLHALGLIGLSQGGGDHKTMATSPKAVQSLCPIGLIPTESSFASPKCKRSLNSLLGFWKAWCSQGALFSIRWQTLLYLKDSKYCEKDLLLCNSLTRTENGEKAILERQLKANVEAQHCGLLGTTLSVAAARGARAVKHQDFSLNISLKYCISVCTQCSILEHCTKWKLKSPSLTAIYQQISIYIKSVTQIYTNCESGMPHFLKAFMNLNLQSALWVWFFSRPLPPAAPLHKEKTSHAQPETNRGVYG